MLYLLSGSPYGEDRAGHSPSRVTALPLDASKYSLAVSTLNLLDQGLGIDFQWRLGQVTVEPDYLVFCP